jgi:septal ring factor EnvC (AmiA/AmiB activator)
MSQAQEERRESLFDEQKAQMDADIAPYQRRIAELNQQIQDAQAQKAAVTPEADADADIQKLQDQLENQQALLKEAVEGSHYYKMYMKD